MAIKFDNIIPEWKNKGVEPSDELKEKGFTGGYKPPATVFNWFWSLVQKCIAEVQNKLIGTESQLNEAITSFDDSIGGLQEEISDLENDIKDVADELKDLEESIKNFEGDYTSLDESIKSLGEDIGGLQEEISDLERDIKDVATDTSELGDKYTALENDYTDLNNRFEALSEHYKLVYEYINDNLAPQVGVMETDIYNLNRVKTGVINKPMTFNNNTDYNCYSCVLCQLTKTGTDLKGTLDITLTVQNNDVDTSKTIKLIVTLINGGLAMISDAIYKDMDGDESDILNDISLVRTGDVYKLIVNSGGSIATGSQVVGSIVPALQDNVTVSYSDLTDFSYTSEVTRNWAY